MEKITTSEIIKFDKNILKNKIIAFPTDTVYGVGCLYLDIEARNKIYDMKKRDYGKPLPILVSDVNMAKTIAQIDDEMMKYTSKWPGALTIIFKTIDPHYIHDTVAIRIPDSKVALKLLNHFGPMEVTSVNYSGEKEINTCDEIEKLFQDKIDYLITDYQLFSSTPSTVLSLVGEKKILRQGAIIFDEFDDEKK